MATKKPVFMRLPEFRNYLLAIYVRKEIPDRNRILKICIRCKKKSDTNDGREVYPSG